jgi:hypothetical protein
MVEESNRRDRSIACPVRCSLKYDMPVYASKAAAFGLNLIAGSRGPKPRFTLNLQQMHYVLHRMKAISIDAMKTRNKCAVKEGRSGNNGRVVRHGAGQSMDQGPI